MCLIRVVDVVLALDKHDTALLIDYITCREAFLNQDQKILKYLYLGNDTRSYIVRVIDEWGHSLQPPRPLLLRA